MQDYLSWGRYPNRPQQAVEMLWKHGGLPLEGDENQTFLPYGNGRSYGDSCLNSGGTLIDVRPLDRYIDFNPKTGVLRCEAGVLLSDILQLIVPYGWFLPVTPGTRYVTIGGAIANDVHGKNHHRAGTFGCHVCCFELLRSDGVRLECSPKTNIEWYQATIGGLGLTGLITWAELQLKPISNPYIQQEIIRYPDLGAFFEISAESDQDFEYTVAWVDCLSSGSGLGRGLFIRGNNDTDLSGPHRKSAGIQMNIPVCPPVSLINHWTLKAFNTFYYHKQRGNRKKSLVHYVPFFYPLDAIGNWNWIYGPRGFLQYQMVVPRENGQDVVHEILRQISRAGIGSFLAILKIFGNRLSPGLMSFPKQGITLALDFPNQGSTPFSLFDSLDEIVESAQGAVYPAKDARMSPEKFRAYFPQWVEFEKYIDPRFSSSFWRRVTGSDT